MSRFPFLQEGRGKVGVWLMAWIGLLQIPAAAERIYLSGRGPEDAKIWDFKVSAGRKSDGWHTIPVPSNWEQHGFGHYDYGYRQAHGKHNETGTYRTTFTIPEKYGIEHYVRIVFEGSMTMTSVRIDGMLIGEPNQGGYNQFSYPLISPIHRKIKAGKLLTMEVEVAELPVNESVDRAERHADFWVFGGIYRPVYLEVLPLNFVDRVAIDADHEGSMQVEVFTQMMVASTKSQEAGQTSCGCRWSTARGKPLEMRWSVLSPRRWP